MGDDMSIVVADAIARLGVAETARRLGTEPESALRLATRGARVRKGTLALAQANVHRLSTSGALPHQ